MSLYDFIEQCKAGGIPEDELMDAIEELNAEKARDAECDRYFSGSTPEEQAGWTFEDRAFLRMRER